MNLENQLKFDKIIAEIGWCIF